MTNDTADAPAGTPKLTRWKKRPAGSNWGDFGPDDQLGRLNLLTPRKVLQGVAEVKEGLRFCLSLPLDFPGKNVLNSRRLPPVLRPNLRNGRPNLNYLMSRDNPEYTDVVSDDLVVLHLQYSTQWDSFAHVGQMFDADGDGHPEPVYYNGFRAGQDIVGPSDPDDAGPPGKVLGTSTSAARALGIENMAANPIQGRAVLIDLHAHFGRARRLVGYDDLQRVLDADRVVIEPGDLVCLHTGFTGMLVEMNRQPDGPLLDRSCAVLDGRDERLLEWIEDSGLAALIADNYSVEAYPTASHVGLCSSLPLHEKCLFRLGVPLGELWFLQELAGWLRANGRNRFLLTAPPLRLPGAIGSPTTPVATV